MHHTPSLPSRKTHILTPLPPTLGTTLIMIATDAFQAYEKATGATMDNTTGLLSITEAQFEKLQSLFFNIGGVQYEVRLFSTFLPLHSPPPHHPYPNTSYYTHPKIPKRTGSDSKLTSLALHPHS